MQIVINIHEKDLECLKRTGRVTYSLISGVIKGTVLPKGHGRLIDADELDRIMYHKAFETDSDMQKWDSGCWIRYKMFENSIKEMSTIIEADKELKDEKL